MRKVLIIGIGAGDPEHVTVQAVNAMNAVDVFLVLDKGDTTADLTEARRAICERFATSRPFRTVVIADPPRDRTAPDYEGAVRDWRDERARMIEEALLAEAEDGVVGILAWGTRRCTTARSASWTRSPPAGTWPSITKSSPASPASRRSPPGTGSC
ncbi:hypothetical protein GCM10027610_102350 [Dactylosporangium cerinum]